jgi:predicted negative regulator of RcsB-dependent stress response
MVRLHSKQHSKDGHIKHKELVRRMKEDELAVGVERVGSWWERIVVPNKGRLIALLLVLAVAWTGVTLFRSQMHRRAMDAQQQYQEAAKAMVEGKLDAANAAVESVLLDGSNTPAGHLARISEADILYSQGKYTQASEIYQELLTTAPEPMRSMVKLSLAFSYESLQQWTKALQLYQELEAACVENKDEPAARALYLFCMGRVATAMGDREQAAKFYNDVPKETFWSAQAIQNAEQLNARVVRMGAADTGAAGPDTATETGSATGESAAAVQGS